MASEWVKTSEPKPSLWPGVKRIGSTGTRFTISDGLWAFIEPLLALHPNTHRFGGDGPRMADRGCADGIFFVLRTGCQWSALSTTGICPSSIKMHQTLALGGKQRRAAGSVRGRSQPHDLKFFAETIWSLPVERGRNSTPAKPQHLCLNKGYGYEQARWLAEAFDFASPPLT